MTDLPAAPPEFFTPGELVAAMTTAGKKISVQAVRYHCRQGLLSGKATLIRRTWFIPAQVAADFAEKWHPYESLRKQK